MAPAAAAQAAPTCATAPKANSVSAINAYPAVPPALRTVTANGAKPAPMDAAERAMAPAPQNKTAPTARRAEMANALRPLEAMIACVTETVPQAKSATAARACLKAVAPRIATAP